MAMKLYCPTCSQAILAEELCRHAEPVCEPCCDDEHGWLHDGDDAA